METNQYFESLKNELKQFCIKNRYIPTNPSEFNEFIIKNYKLDNLHDFVVNTPKPIIIKNKPVRKIQINSNQPYYACIPIVWQTMTDAQKIQSTKMMFECIYNLNSARLLGKPQLVFIDNDPKSKRRGGQITTDKLDLLYIALNFVLTSKSGLDVLGVIIHEFTHAEQAYDREKIQEYLLSHNYNFLSLPTCPKRLRFNDSGIVSRSINNLYQKVITGREQIHVLSKEDANLWIKLEKEHDREWSQLKDLPYVCNQNELLAESNVNKTLNKVLNIYRQECDAFSLEVPSLLDMNLSSLKKFGYDISAEQLENFAQMSNMAHMTRQLNFTYTTIKYLLDVYKEKKVDKPFAENYQKIEDGYFKSLQAYYQQENEETK